MISFAVFLDLVVLRLFSKANVLDSVLRYWLCLYLVLYAFSFPLALYLNRRRRESSSQSAITNAS
jgi:hypothetical protein